MRPIFAVLLGFLLLASPRANAQTLPSFDFTKAEAVQEWKPAHDIANLGATAEGLTVEIGGNDPYFVGPPRDYPAKTPLWLTIRCFSEVNGTAQIFYYTDAPREENSVRFDVTGGTWSEKRVPLPSFGSRYRLRIDPPGTAGKFQIATMRFAPRVLPQAPQWPRPTAPTVQSGASLKSGDLTLGVGANLGNLALKGNGRDVAIGFNKPLVGYTVGDNVRWLDLSNAKTTAAQNSFSSTARDEDGANWQWKQSFKAGKLPGTIEVISSVTVDQDREVVLLPMLVIFPGAGSFGESKKQALFPGLEYLDNEPSSSEADIRGPQSKRAVPDSLKITLPMMAVQNGDSYIGLAWREEQNTRERVSARFSALFDSPDRIFKSGGHVMGLIFPGSNGANRIEGNLLPYQGEILKANETLTLSAVIFGGRGDSAVDAVKHFVAWHGLPKVPDAGDFKSYNALASAGWLDSKIREGEEFRHAFWPGFERKPAADAALLMEYLAAQGSENATRLRETAKAALSRVDLTNANAVNVSHVTYPLAALVYGHVAENANHSEQSARGTLKRFEADGSVLYQKRPNAPDYGSTHFAPDANGLSAQVVAALLENASFCGDKSLLSEAIVKLRALDKFKNSVPRGAQTWEVPLHTPDILASANLVRAYTRGYELTGEKHFLEQAIHWAWTGVPFIYLRNPTDKAVGPYSTIAVLGATSWRAPIWMGQPVQWCGLVYSDALYRLATHEPAGPWKQLADGITAAGIQHTWKASDKNRVGLLPDYFLLRPQISDGPAINPGTLQTNAVRLFNQPALYDFFAARECGLLIHAPGAISQVKQSKTSLSLSVSGWPPQPYFVLINGLKAAPQVRINGQSVPISAPHQFDAEKGRLILQTSGKAQIELKLMP